MNGAHQQLGAAAIGMGPFAAIAGNCFFSFSLLRHDAPCLARAAGRRAMELRHQRWTSGENRALKLSARRLQLAQKIIREP